VLDENQIPAACGQNTTSTLVLRLTKG
jgi:hypothetical protein